MANTASAASAIAMITMVCRDEDRAMGPPLLPDTMLSEVERDFIPQPVFNQPNPLYSVNFR